MMMPPYVGLVRPIKRPKPITYLGWRTSVRLRTDFKASWPRVMRRSAGTDAHGDWPRRSIPCVTSGVSQCLAYGTPAACRHLLAGAGHEHQQGPGYRPRRRGERSDEG